MENDVKPGMKSTEFWVQLVAHFAPLVAAYVVNTVAPQAPWAAAALGIVAAVAGHFSASQYSDDRTALKQATTEAVSRVIAAQAAAVAQQNPSK